LTYFPGCVKSVHAFTVNDTAISYLGKGMGKADQFSSIFWLILGLAVVYGSNRLGLGTLTHPGPGFLSFWCGIFLAALSVPVFIKGAKMRRAGDEAKFEKQWSEVRWSKSVYVVLSTLAYALAFTYVGFLLGTTLLLIFLFKAIEPEKWTIAVGSAILASLISFLVFGLWLDVQLPRGLVERLVF